MKGMCILAAGVLLIPLGVQAGQQNATAGDFKSNEVTTDPVVGAEVTHTSPEDTPAVQGFSAPTPFFGVGGLFGGGWTGVTGAALAPGVGERIGVFGWGEGGVDINYGLVGWLAITR